MFFEFARNLPEKRCIDYQLSLTGKMQKSSAIVAASGDESDLNGTLKPTKSRKTATPSKKEFSTPFDVYKKANADMKFHEARNNFSKLSNKKLLKYIKEAESLYDAVRKQQTLTNRELIRLNIAIQVYFLFCCILKEQSTWPARTMQTIKQDGNETFIWIVRNARRDSGKVNTYKLKKYVLFLH